MELTAMTLCIWSASMIGRRTLVGGYPRDHRESFTVDSQGPKTLFHGSNRLPCLQEHEVYAPTFR